jgi:hypothetical protein
VVALHRFPGGKERAENPYEDRTFDFAILTSVFTHLTPEEAEYYVNELHRALKPAATCLINYSLLTVMPQRHRGGA